jgi:hypothetical protein
MTGPTTDRLQGLTVSELGDDPLRCLECGTEKPESDDDWLIDSGIINCPDCKTRWAHIE